MAEVTIRHRFIHQAPRKLRIVSNIVRGHPADRAIAELGTRTRLASGVIAKAIKAAVAAASEQGLNKANLFISHITVDEGPRMRRFIPQSRGRSQRIEKQMSHLTIKVTDEPVTIASSKVYKRELGKATKTTKKTEIQEVIAPVAEPAEAPTEAQKAESVTTEGSK